jgi:hypothetical protein
MQTAGADGSADVELALTVANATLPTMHIQILGNQQGGGVQMTSSAVTIGTATDPALFRGQITSLQGTDIDATASSAEQTVQLTLTLQINSGTVSGTLQLSPSR